MLNPRKHIKIQVMRPQDNNIIVKVVSLMYPHYFGSETARTNAERLTFIPSTSEWALVHSDSAQTDKTQKKVHINNSTLLLFDDMLDYIEFIKALKEYNGTDDLNEFAEDLDVELYMTFS